MRLERLSIKNYRSIEEARRVDVSSTTVLIGKNNEGKSNLLAALTAAMTVVAMLGETQLAGGGRLRIPSHLYRRIYDWERDFPIPLQEHNPNGESVFRLDFSLSERERAEFRNEVKSSLNDNLPIEIRFGRAEPTLKVVKPGKGAKPLNDKREKIAKFVGDRMEFTYIPAVRTAEATKGVVAAMVAKELRTLEADPNYQKAMKALADLRRPRLESISKRIQSALVEFLPRVGSVEVVLEDETRRHIMARNVDVKIDDGTVTSLAAKGDGVQSLAAIGLLRGVSPSGKHLILALEEPESHLHPGAIHQLREVIYGLAEQHQIVLTTHCPLFADRQQVASNVIVSDNSARPAKTIAEIRELLGVRASDNLTHATHVLIVEGESDVVILGALFRHSSPKLRAAIGKELAILPLHGVGNLTYKLGELRNAVCNCHCYLDYDPPAKDAVRRAQEEHLIGPAECNYAICQGMAESEVEDLIVPSLYASEFEERLGAVLQVKEFRGSQKWSVRVSNVLRAQGKDPTRNLMKAAKDVVAQQVRKAPASALIQQKRSSFDALVEVLEKKLSRPTEVPLTRRL